jgi:hypothetical protein
MTDLARTDPCCPPKPIKLAHVAGDASVDLRDARCALAMGAQAAFVRAVTRGRTKRGEDMVAVRTRFAFAMHCRLPCDVLAFAAGEPALKAETAVARSMSTYRRTEALMPPQWTVWPLAKLAASLAHPATLSWLTLRAQAAAR